jgi:hypothetical protein
MKKIIIFLFITLYANISNYHNTFYCIDKDNVVIRTFKQNNIDKILVVNLNTLKTKILINHHQIPLKCNKNTKYIKLLTLSSSSPYPLQNDGITHGKNGMFITTDLCPSSKKGFEQHAYQKIIDNFQNPAPVTIFITSKWINKHKKSFLQLIKWKKEKKLDITWGNHTATHPYKRNFPINNNFALIKNYNLKQDTLNLEKILIEYNQTPSVFFRFPGLVSDKKTIDTIYSLGLITIGANAWLAKGEKPKKGSIILIHGNKNEHIGIKIFIKLIKNHKISNIKSLNQL